MRRASLLLLALASVASAGGVTRAPPAIRTALGKSIRAPQKPGLGSYFPTSGQGVPAAGSLCDVFASELTGNYFCLRGTGTQTSSAGMSLTAVGSPVTETRPESSNGPDCTPVTAQRLDGSTQYFKTGATAAGAPSDFTTWAVVRVDSRTPNQYLVAKHSSTPGTLAWALLLAPGGSSTQLFVFRSDGTSTATTGAGSVVATQRTLVVATYHAVGDGTSVATVYVDGVQVAQSTTMALINPASTLPITVGANSTPAQFTGGRIYSAGYTEKLLSPTTIAAMAATFRPPPTGTRGEALTFTRASTATATCTTGEIGTVPANVPRIVQGGLLMEPAATEVLLNNGGANPIATGAAVNSPWTTTGTITIAGNSWDSGLGSATGFTATDASGATSATVQQAITTSTTGAWTLSCAFQAGTLSAARLQFVVTGGTGSSICTFSDLATQIGDAARRQCTTTVGAGVTAITAAVLVGSAAADQGSIRIDRCQLEQGSSATSWISAGGTAATRAAESATVAAPAALSATEGCAKVCFTPNWTGTFPPGTTGMLLVANNGSTFRPAYISGSSVGTYDGTAFTAVLGGFLGGSKSCYRSTWSASAAAKTIFNLTGGGSSTSTGFTSMGASGGVIGIGTVTASPGAEPLGIISDIQLGTSAGGCQ